MAMPRYLALAAIFLAVLALGLASPEATDRPEEQSRGLVLGGDDAVQNRYPYFTRIDLPDRFEVCGGTLIASDMVLTNPSCNITLPGSVLVGFLKNSLDGDEVGVTETFVHPSFTPETGDHAFRIMKLDQTSLRAFPTLNADPNVPVESTALHVAGLGNNRAKASFNFPNTLQEASIPFIPRAACDATRTVSGQPYAGLIRDSMFCVGNENAAVCEQDWGSPVVVRGATPLDDVLVGVVNWSFGCGSSNPGVVARISEGYDWIRFVVCENAASPPSYLNCASATDPNIQPPLTPPAPINPIDFQFTFTTDDFSFEYGYILERIDGLDTRIVDYVVPNGFPFSATYERTITLQEGALYAWQITDQYGGGLELNDGGASLRLQNSEGAFVEIHTEDTSFTNGISYLFYASLGEVEDRFDRLEPFEGGAFLRMTITLDDYPWEFGFQLTTTDGKLIFYRPPRVYYRDAGEEIVENISVPNGTTTFNLTVVDTYGDGLQGGNAGYKLTDSTDRLVLESRFRDVGREEKSFTYTATPSSTALPTVYLSLFAAVSISWALSKL